MKSITGAILILAGTVAIGAFDGLLTFILFCAGITYFIVDGIQAALKTGKFEGSPQKASTA